MIISISDNLSETLRKVRQLLQQYNLVKRDGSQALVTQMETDQSECTVPSQQGLSASLKHVDLWPLYDDVFVLSELRLVNEMLSSADSVGPEKTGALVNFGDQFTSLSPAVLASLRTVSIERKVAMRLANKKKINQSFSGQKFLILMRQAGIILNFIFFLTWL